MTVKHIKDQIQNTISSLEYNSNLQKETSDKAEIDRLAGIAIKLNNDIKDHEAEIAEWEQMDKNPKFISYIGYTDRHAFEVVRIVSDKTLEIRRLTAERDESVEMEFVIGGFSAHCTTNNAQKWLFSSNPNQPTVRVRRSKHDREIWVNGTSRYRITAQPEEFYDYNF